MRKVLPLAHDVLGGMVCMIKPKRWGEMQVPPEFCMFHLNPYKNLFIQIPDKFYEPPTTIESIFRLVFDIESILSTAFKNRETENNVICDNSDLIYIV